MRIGAHSKEALKRATPLGRLKFTPAQCSNLSPLVARGYHSWRTRSLGLLSGEAFGLDREARLFRALARPGPGERWLDVGTSSGFYAGVLAEAGARVLALDVSPAMLRAAQERQASAHIEWGLLNIEDSGLPSGRFHGVTVGATLNETADPERALGEVQRLLRPQGRLWLMYVARSGGEVQRALSRLGGTTFPDRAEVARALHACDLRAALVVREVTFELYVRR